MDEVAHRVQHQFDQWGDISWSIVFVPLITVAPTVLLNTVQHSATQLNTVQHNAGHTMQCNAHFKLDITDCSVAKTRYCKIKRHRNIRLTAMGKNFVSEGHICTTFLSSQSKLVNI